MLPDGLQACKTKGFRVDEVSATVGRLSPLAVTFPGVLANINSQRGTTPQTVPSLRALRAGYRRCARRRRAQHQSEERLTGPDEVL